VGEGLTDTLAKKWSPGRYAQEEKEEMGKGVQKKILKERKRPKEKSVAIEKSSNSPGKILPKEIDP